MMAAVTLALAFSAFLMALGNLFGAGAGTYVSRLLGEGNVEGVKKVSSVNFWSSMLTGVIFMAICLPLISSLLQLLRARGDTLLYTSAFLLDGFMVITCLLFNNFAAFYGDNVIAGLGISQRVVQIADFISMGFSMGAVRGIFGSESLAFQSAGTDRQISQVSNSKAIPADLPGKRGQCLRSDENIQCEQCE